MKTGLLNQSFRGVSTKFLLGNETYYFHDPKSSYGGLSVRKNNLQWKIFDAFETPSKQVQLTRISAVGEDWHIHQENQDTIKLFTKKTLPLHFDIRPFYDRREFGKYYTISTSKESTTITYKKYTDQTEDSTHGVLEHSFTVIIQGMVLPGKGWVHKPYISDEIRGDIREGHSYEAIVLTPGNHTIIIKDAPVSKPPFNRNNGIFGVSQRIQNYSFSKRDILASAMLQLSAGGKFIAGFPWFYQCWSRDEIISARGLSLCDIKVKERVWYWFRKLDQQGLLPVYEGASTLCKDSTGWLFLRLSQMKCTATEQRKILPALKKTINTWIDRNTLLVYADPFMTWMDTGDGRSGARIEIQALCLAMVLYLYKQTNDPFYKKLETKMRAAVRKAFFHEGYLYDGSADPTKRPNAFLAAYMYPQLLTKGEWISCFKILLKALWLSWGGLASIDKDSPCFKSSHTGINNASYHNGDSWFWVNNLAALAMHRVDKHDFGTYIQKIYDASWKDCLAHGAVGCCSEISDAKQLHAQGCMSQLWSTATLMELMNGIKDENER